MTAPPRTAEAFRDDVFARYGLTPEARALLRGTRLRIADLSAPHGGGLWFGPRENRIELHGAQDEALLHEYAHAWADLTGFYDEREPHGPPWPTRNRAFRADVTRAAHESDHRYARAAYLASEYTYGNPITGFRGMGENDAERFAGLASGCMGDLRLLPPYLRRWYRGLFRLPD